MSTTVTRQLNINEDNVKQFCTANDVSLDAGGYAIRKWLNGSTSGYATLTSAAKDVLYPSATAHPFKLDSSIRGSRSAGSMTVNLQFGGTTVHSESFTSGSLHTKTKTDITDTAVTGSTKNTEIRWNIQGKNGDNQRVSTTDMTMYFYQYSMSVNIGTDANGVQSVSVSNSAPYYGDSVTFSAALVKGSTWHGWYSDAACTALVSSEQNYTVSPSSDITLYAKAVNESTLYNCAAVAGVEISSVSVSDTVVPEGETAVFTAQVNTGCTFEAWYSDSTYTTVVSTENPYTATITANTTLYAKAHRNELHISVGTAEHGVATVSATTVLYGSDVTFTFTPESGDYELYGWYSDEGLTQLVSDANPYTFTATGDITLYPRVGKKRYTISLSTPSQFANSVHTLLSVDLDSLTSTEKVALRHGELDSIAQDKVFDKKTVTSSFLETYTIAIKCPMGYAVGMSATNSNSQVTLYFSSGNETLTNWPYYSTVPISDQNYQSVKERGTCYCSAVAQDGIISAYVPYYVVKGKTAPFEAEVMPGYIFSGWYSDAAIVSSENPANIITPAEENTPTLILYARAAKATYTIGVGTSEHCTASVSATTAQHGDSVTFDCIPDEGYEFKGWYSDEGLAQLVSESASYEHTVVGSITLWPKVEPSLSLCYSVSVRSLSSSEWDEPYRIKAAIIDLESLTSEESDYLKTGEYELIDKDKVYSFVDNVNIAEEATLLCPLGKSFAVWGEYPNGTRNNVVAFVAMQVQNGEVIDEVGWPEYVPYLYFNPSDYSFELYPAVIDVYANYGYSDFGITNCTAIALTGIEQAYAATPIVHTDKCFFEAKVSPGYSFSGWYKDQECNDIVAGDNPLEMKLHSNRDDADDSLTLYAKATLEGVQPTGVFLKPNSTWEEAHAVYRKIDGEWVEALDECKSVLSQKDRTGTIVQIV